MSLRYFIMRVLLYGYFSVEFLIMRVLLYGYFSVEFLIVFLMSKERKVKFFDNFEQFFASTCTFKQLFLYFQVTYYGRRTLCD